MDEKQYLNLLENMVLSLVVDRHRRCESVNGNHSLVQSIFDRYIAWSPSDIESLINEQRGLRVKSLPTKELV